MMYEDKKLEKVYTPFTYRIGWSRLNKHYYGVRYAKYYACVYETGCHPDDLWQTYFTSSKYVRCFIEENGQPDIVEVRKIFYTAEEAMRWEENVLKRLGAVKSDKWLNKNDSTTKRHTDTLTETHKDRIRKSLSKPKEGRALEAAITNLKKAIDKNTGKKRPKHAELMRKKGYLSTMTPEQRLEQDRNRMKRYFIEGKIYVGQKAVVDVYGVSPYILNKRLKSEEYDWRLLKK